MFWMLVDSKHACDKLSRCSQAGFVIFLNDSTIGWLSKTQSTIETSVFGAKFCTMRHEIETLHGIPYKLCMMGIPVEEPSFTKVSKPKSPLRKKLNMICYHAVHEAVAMGKALVAHVPTQKNLADLFTKVLYGSCHQFLVERMLWDVYPTGEPQDKPGKGCG